MERGKGELYLVTQVPHPFQLLRTGRRSFAGFEVSRKFPASKIGLAVKLPPLDPPLDDVLEFSIVIAG